MKFQTTETYQEKIAAMKVSIAKMDAFIVDSTDPIKTLEKLVELPCYDNDRDVHDVLRELFPEADDISIYHEMADMRCTIRYGNYTMAIDARNKSRKITINYVGPGSSRPASELDFSDTEKNEEAILKVITDLKNHRHDALKELYALNGWLDFLIFKEKNWQLFQADYWEQKLDKIRTERAIITAEAEKHYSHFLATKEEFLTIKNKARALVANKPGYSIVFKFKTSDIES